MQKNRLLLIKCKKKRIEMKVFFVGRNKVWKGNGKYIYKKEFYLNVSKRGKKNLDVRKENYHLSKGAFHANKRKIFFCLIKRFRVERILLKLNIFVRNAFVVFDL